MKSESYFIHSVLGALAALGISSSAHATPPVPPTNLTATVGQASQSSITLNWSHPEAVAPNYIHFAVIRTALPGSTVQLVSGYYHATTYIDMSAVSGSYRYCVYAWRPLPPYGSSAQTCVLVGPRPSTTAPTKK